MRSVPESCNSSCTGHAPNLHPERGGGQPSLSINEDIELNEVTVGTLATAVSPADENC